jgi:alkylation response protein AidB-like acyl-CoA dehydrogenase
MPGSEPLDAALQLRELIESEAESVEQSATMTPAVVDALVESGLFRLLVPRQLGGLEATPTAIVVVCEELSYADGSVGWAFAQIAAGGRTRLGSLPLREQPTFQQGFGQHSVAVKAARLLAVDCHESALETLSRAGSPDAVAQKLRETKAAASHVTAVAKAAVGFAYEASGSQGMRNPSRLQRCFRDIYVGAAHQVFDERNYIELAKPDLSLEPAPS